MSGTEWERPSEELLGMGRVKLAERVVVFRLAVSRGPRTRAPHAALRALGAAGPARDEPGSPLPSGCAPGRSSSSPPPPLPPLLSPSRAAGSANQLPARAAAAAAAPPPGPDAHPY